MKRQILILFFAVCFIFNLLISTLSTTASAATILGPTGNTGANSFDNAVTNATYTFQDRATIIVNLPGIGNVNFTDSNISDPNNDYMPPVTSQPTANSFCNLNNGSPAGIELPYNTQWGSSLINGKLNIGYWYKATCTPTTTKTVSISNPNSVANAKFEWSGNSIKSLDQNGTVFNSTPNAPSGNQTYITSGTNGNCPNQAILVGSSSGQGTLFSLAAQSAGARGGSPYPAAPTSLGVPSDCHVSFQRGINIVGTQGSSPVSGTGSQQGSGGSQTPTCDTSGFNLSWVLCPIIEGAVSAIQGIYTNLLEPLLKMNSQDLLSGKYYQAWSAFRDYANVILIIILLVIVFGEAIGGGG